MLDKGAIFSGDRIHRYRLWRVWNPERPMVSFVGLNPSTADENVDDPTVRRCIGFALQWKCGGMNMYNIFALRSTDPMELIVNREYAVGPDNDKHLKEIKGKCVVAWGNWGRLHGRSEAVKLILPEAECFGLTKKLEPLHPLYLHHEAALVPWVNNAVTRQERHG